MDDETELQDIADSDKEISNGIDAWGEFTDEQRLRMFIHKHYSSSGEPSSIDGRIYIENMDAIFKWIMDGNIPPPPRKKAALRAVE